MNRPDYRMPLAVFICCVSLMALIIVRAHAQTGAGSQWSTAFTSGPLSTCPTPAAGSIIQCAVTNVGVEESVNGKAYVPVNQLPVQGAKGDTGPAGPVGPMGPAGPQGPAGTNATAPVTSVNGKTGAVTLALQ
jgi:hypothetical protein